MKDLDLNKNKYVANVLQQKMTRKEFVMYLGVSILTVAGVTNFIKNLKQIGGHQAPSANKSQQLSGYGVGPYGR